MSYAANYYKTSDHKFDEFFAAYNDSEDAIKVKKEMDRLSKELEEKTAMYTLLVGKRYNAEFTPYEKVTTLSYTDRNNNTYNFDAVTGAVFSGDVSETHNIDLENRNGYFVMLAGYCYSLGAVVTRKYKYSIQSNNQRVSLKLIHEELVPMFENIKVTMSALSGNIDVDYRTAYGLGSYNADDFINKFFGLDKSFGLSFSAVKSAVERNKSFEVIVRTCDDKSLMNKLLQFSVDKAKPIHEIIGCSKADMKYAENLGVLEEFVDLKQRIAIDRFYKRDSFAKYLSKTDKEWIDIIEKVKHWEEDLRFYTINTGGNLLDTLIHGYIGGEYPYYYTGLPNYYQFGKFCSYVVEESINQGYTNVREFVRMLSDYIKMCEDLNVTPTLYSSYLHQTHDIVSRNHKIKLAEEQEKMFAERYKDFKPWVGEKYIITAPKSSHDLQAEGDALNHCVASYIKRVVDGECEIYFLRLIDKADKSLVTFEVRNKQIVQARGLHNRAITEEEKIVLLKYCKDRKITFR